MECVTKPIDYDCNGEHIIDMSFLRLVIHQPPSKAVCPAPEIYPGSTLDGQEVYDQLPGDLSVRCAMSDPWSHVPRLIWTSFTSITQCWETPMSR